MNGDGTPVPVVKQDIGRLRIELDSESEHDMEEEQILNYKPQEDDVVLPEATRSVYGTDNYEWNNYNKPKGEVCDFSQHDYFLKIFNVTVNPFLPMAQNYEPGSQPINGLYQTLLYSLIHEITGEHVHAADFSCIDNDLLSELVKIKKQVESCHTAPLFESKLHLINDISITYGFFLKLYVMQKKLGI